MAKLPLRSAGGPGSGSGLSWPGASIWLALIIFCLLPPTGAYSQDEPQSSPRRISSAAVHFYDFNQWSVIGSLREHRVQGRESLHEIARDYGLGYREITRANPELEPFLPGDGAKVLIPAAKVLPEVPFSQGILLNLAEKRLYYFFQRNGEDLVITFPVGIGVLDADTPGGDFTITARLSDPSWTPPASIRARRPYLPAVIPPGPDNPMGTHALQLSRSSYYIHGTNRPWSIGRRATHGCIRLYPEDIPVLFAMAEVETPVRIINQPVKIGRREESIYIEVHPEGEQASHWRQYLAEAEKILREKGLEGEIDRRRLEEAVRRGQGFAVLISPGN